MGPFLRLLLCPLLGKRLFQRPHLGLPAGNGLLRQAGFLVGSRQLTVDLGSRCPMGGYGCESGRNGRHGPGVDGHAMRSLRSLLLGDADGALHGSAVLPGPLPDDPKVAGHPTDALTGARHVPVGSDAAAGAGLVGRHPPAVGRLHVAAGACWGLLGPQEQLTGLGLGLPGDLDEVAEGGVAGVMTTIGPLGTGGWGSALGALGCFGGQGLLVLPPPPVPLPVPGGPLLLPQRDALLLPCSLRSLPGSGKFFSIMSHMETLIEAPDGYTLGSSSSSIPSGRRPSPGLSGQVHVLQRLRRKRYSYPSARSHSSTARRRSSPMSSRSSKLPGMPPSHWGWLWR